LINKNNKPNLNKFIFTKKKFYLTKNFIIINRHQLISIYNDKVFSEIKFLFSEYKFVKIGFVISINQKLMKIFLIFNLNLYYIN